jgi:hypothetical protein
MSRAACISSIRVIRGRVFYHRDLIAKLSGIANSRFDAGVCNQPDDDELMDAVPLELQIKVGVGEAAGAPMLSGNDHAVSENRLFLSSRFQNHGRDHVGLRYEAG